MSKAEYLVVDSGGFIANAPLREIANHVITLKDVVDEIRDKPTRQRLQVLPYDLEFRQPSAAGLKIVTEFSKKTGDYASLSATDLKVLAVTYDVQKEKGGVDHLNAEPVTKKTVEFYKPNKGIPVGDKKIAGFYAPSGDETEEQNYTNEEDISSFSFWRDPIGEIPEDLQLDEEIPKDIVDFSEQELCQLNQFLQEKSFFSSFQVSPVDFFLFHKLSSVDLNSYPNLQRWYSHIDSYSHAESQSTPLSLKSIKSYISSGTEFTPEQVKISADDLNENSEYKHESSDEGVILEDEDSDQENYEEEDEEEDEEGWITPSNLKEKARAMLGTDGEDAKVDVACITTDFAMQNVLKQIGLNIIGANGMLIKETKTWILRCYACCRTTPHLDKKFCPKCGNKTLKRVSVTLNKDGTQQIHISTRREISTRGKKYSLPAPKGGKHGFNPKLSDDQRDAQQRLSKKAIQKNNPMDPDYIAGNSPFTTKDVTSKSAQLGLKGPGYGQAQPTGAYWAKKNPNSGSKNTGNKRKK